MKRCVLALLIAAAMLLTGCSTVLNREFFSVTPHNAALMDTDNPSVLRANTYQEIVNALMYFISQGTEHGTMRVYVDSKKLDGFLDAAQTEVIKEDPLGAYAVERIDCQVEPLNDHSEVSVQIHYRRSHAQITSIVSVNGSTAIRQEFKGALSTFSPQSTLRLGYFDQDESYILTLARQAYYDSPLSALDFPELDVQTCPDHGRQRIVELSMSYHLAPDQLKERKNAVNDALSKLQRTVPFVTNRHDITPIAAVLHRRVTYDSSAEFCTPWHALILGRANSEGLALTFAALCQKLGIPCRVADGQLSGAPHFWNIVQTQEGWRHLDLTEAADTPSLWLDTDMTRAGYVWSSDVLPHCSPAPRA